MASANSVKLDSRLFAPSSIPDDAATFNENLMNLALQIPKWYEVGAQRYREMRDSGETPLPARGLLDSAQSLDIPSRDAGRGIPCRVLRPTNGKIIRAVFMHVHGGGWVLSSEKSQDAALQDQANANSLLMLSVGYRLAPEDPFPAGPNDCYDVAEWLIDNARSHFGADLGFFGGESAGAHLSLLTALHLLQHQKPVYNTFNLKGLILNFGWYDLTMTPSTYHFKKPGTLVIDKDVLDHYIEVFVPAMSHEEKRDPAVSPLFADLQSLRGRLPPALFTCGTEDCLLDDTVFMSAKYQMAGATTETLIVPGAAHGYCMFPKETKGAQADIGMAAIESFIEKHA